jgi:hypothetical protein
MEEIGLHQEGGQPLCVKELQLLNLAPVATLQRRLRRLIKAGAISARRSGRDARIVELTISPAVMRIYARYAAFFTQTAE